MTSELNRAPDRVCWHRLQLSLFSWGVSTCQDLSEVGCETEEPHCFLFNPKHPLWHSKKPSSGELCDTEKRRGSNTATYLWTWLECCQDFSFRLVQSSLVFRGYLSLFALLQAGVFFSCCFLPLIWPSVQGLYNAVRNRWHEPRFLS